MHGGTGHSEIVIEDLRVPDANMLGGRGQGHLLGQYRLGPARLAHCMRWIAQAETALDMMVDRSLNRFSHGSMLAEKQGIQWMIADSTMELYQAKLMVLHAAYRIDNKLDFKSEVSMAKHFVANMLGRVIDRAIQVHGALGYSTDTPLAHMFQHARWARFADGADEIHQMRIAQRTIAAYRDTAAPASPPATCPSEPGPRRRTPRPAPWGCCWACGSGRRPTSTSPASTRTPASAASSPRPPESARPGRSRPAAPSPGSSPRSRSATGAAWTVAWPARASTPTWPPGRERAVVLALPDVVPEGTSAESAAIFSNVDALAALAASGTKVFHRTPERCDPERLMDPDLVADAFAMGHRQAREDAEELRAFLA